MRERPILFSGPMVRAILDGRKTQTRRLVTPQPAPNAPNDGGTVWVRQAEGLHVPYGTVGHLTVREKTGLRCPYGVPGDRLWVRETWYCDHCFERDYETTRRTYVGRTLTDAECEAEWRGNEATGSLLFYRADGEAGQQFEQLEHPTGRIWKPSIHMPRWASRLTLDVTSVRVERLHDISEEDARAEGVERYPEPFTLGWRNYEPEPSFESISYHPTARESFASLWRSINGAESWESDPWVWAVEFRRMEARP